MVGHAIEPFAGFAHERFAHVRAMTLASSFPSIDQFATVGAFLKIGAHVFGDFGSVSLGGTGEMILLAVGSVESTMANEACDLRGPRGLVEIR